MTISEAIQGWSNVVAQFGNKPDFHDAEIRAVNFADRDGLATVTLWWLRANYETKEYSEAETDFVLVGVRRIAIEHWDTQNVVNNLTATKAEDGSVIVSLDPSVGAHIQVEASSIEVLVRPMEATSMPGWTRRAPWAIPGSRV